MLFAPTMDHRDGLLGLLAQRWREWKEQRDTLAGLEICGRGEAARMAHDLSLSPRELRSLAHQRVDSAEQLYRRMIDLGLDRDAIAYREARALRDMQKTCSLCDAKRHCRRDIARGSEASAWHVYCPNDATLQALAAAGACRAGLEARAAALASTAVDDHRRLYSSLLILLLVVLASLALFAIPPMGLRSHPGPVAPTGVPAWPGVTCLDAGCLSPTQQSALLGIGSARARGVLASSAPQRAALAEDARIVQMIAADEAQTCARRGGVTYYGLMFQEGCNAGGSAAAILDGYSQCLPMAGGGACLIKVE